MQRRQLTLAFAGSLAGTFAAGLFGHADVHAQAGWPDKPIKWVLSQPPGSGPDNVARLLAEHLHKGWGQAIVVDNKPGGQNTIGALAAARSPADGLTFYFATTAALVSNPLLFKSLPYDPAKDFVPVAFIARSPFAILVAASSPLKTIDELVARSKADAGKFSLGNEGPRTFSGIIARLFNARSKAEANPVPYASVGVGMQDLIGGHVDAMVADVASTAQLVKQGRLRMLATTSAKRVAGWESVPALAETYPGFDMAGWFAMVAPTGTPAAVIQRVNADINKQLAERELADKIATIGPIADASMSPEQVGEFLRSEQRRWGAIAKEIGLLPE